MPLSMRCLLYTSAYLSGDDSSLGLVLGADSFYDFLTRSEIMGLSLIHIYVICTLLVYDGRIIGGDISTSGEESFTHGFSMS